MPGWDDLFTAQAGAAAALAGLLFVGLSLNMQKIIGSPGLPSRALLALILLVSLLLVSLVLLVPAQPTAIVGIELAGMGAGITYATARVGTQSYRLGDHRYAAEHLVETAVSITSTSFYIAAGVVTFFAGTRGFYLVVPAALIAFAVAITDAWILLVEINR